MSDKEIPRRSALEDEPHDLDVPPMPARWDDPPTSLSDDELVRMEPNEDHDALLAAVSDALWEPDFVEETPAVHAERLRRITERGSRLRARWAETAALEEAYATAAATPTLKERQRAAKQRQQESVQHYMRRKQRRSRLIRSAVCAQMTIALTGVGTVVTMSSTLWTVTFVTMVATVSAVVMVLLLAADVPTAGQFRRCANRRHKETSMSSTE
jgi:hypothetical protein